MVKAPPSFTRSFKIRNHTNNHRIKENTIPVQSGRKNHISNRLLPSVHNTIEAEAEKQTSTKKSNALVFQPYPSTLELPEIGNRTQF